MFNQPKHLVSGYLPKGTRIITNDQEYTLTKDLYFYDKRDLKFTINKLGKMHTKLDKLWAEQKIDLPHYSAILFEKREELFEDVMK